MMKIELIKYLVACTVLLSACGSFKEKKTLHTQEHESVRQNQDSSAEQSWQKDNTLLLDTSNSEYVVQITPMGKFFYSTEKGFEGMARKVVVKGRANKRQVVHRHKETEHQLVRQNNNTEHENSKIKVQQVDKRIKPRWGFALIGMVMLFVLAYWIWRKWRLI
ncbi:hypothetical protein SAMN05421827_105238 [Pedobacter terrae]|uniref:Lipoprotein n=1 Tax=Pedobacter terrae TaxID=405671 RepID=A0A1G7TIK6_9SPHI|nr:hypothetical protein [Pedobacter terrae]SDG34854.1 hypothetical protein SAMN05421827_105238 [Pedobacter terrae]